MEDGAKRRDLEDRTFLFAESVRDGLSKEARELTLIFSAIISKSSGT
jgi:hypothetical protein